MIKKCWQRAISILLAVLFTVAPYSIGDVQVYAENTTAGGPYVNLIQNQTYTVNTPASVDFPDSGRKATDGVYDTTATYSNLEWIGFYRETYGPIIIDVLFDLKQSKTVEQLTMNFLHDTQCGMSYPDFISFNVSEDGINYTELERKPRPAATLPSETHKYVCSPGTPASARYVKISFEIGYYYPDTGDGRWHSLFDEIEIIGKDTPGGASRNLALGLPYKFQSTPAGYNTPEASYPDKSNELTDGRLATTDIYDDNWQGHFASTGNVKEISFDLKQKKGIRSISANFLKNTAGSTKVNLPARVDFMISVDGNKWTTLTSKTNNSIQGDPATSKISWDIAVDGAPGISNVELVSAQYAKIKYYVDNAAFIDEVEILGSNDNPGVEIPNIIPYINLAQNQTYTVNYPADVNFPDTSRKATDGKYDATATYSNLEWVGFYRATYDPIIIDVLFDLKQSKTIEQITMNFLHDTQCGMSYPDFISFNVSEDGINYTELERKPRPAATLPSETYKYVCSPGTPASARYVKISFEIGYYYPDTGDGRWNTMFDEIEIIGKDTPGGASRNLALGLPYKYQSTPAGYNAPNPGYPDPNAELPNSELTDGKFGTTDINDNNWQGHFASTGNVKEIDFDLKQKKGIRSISANFLKNTTGSTKVNLPSKVEFLISTDGANWKTVAEKTTTPVQGDTEISKISWDIAADGILGIPDGNNIDLASAQYVKIKYYVDNAAFIDEVEILGSNNNPGVEIPTEIVCVNLAANKTYRVNSPASENFSDTGKKATDGKYSAAPNCNNPEWMGFYRETYAPIVIHALFDLKENKSIEQLTINFLHDNQYGYSYPEFISFNVSQDGKNYTEVERKTRPAATLPSETHKYVCSPGTPVSARYVKISFEIGYYYPNTGEGRWHGVFDEIEIIGKDTVNGEAKNLALGLPYKFESTPAGYNYTRSPYLDPNVELTDGKYGTTDINDTAWQGHFASSGSVKEITVDLEQKKGIRSISANFLKNTAGDVKVNLPTKVVYMVSNDGTKWASLAEKATISVQGDPATSKISWDIEKDGLPDGVTADLITAQYVKIKYYVDNAAFIDEVEIIGSNDNMGVAIPDDFNGLSNISKGLHYTWSQTPSTTYPDSNYEMTDGIYGGTDYTNAAWSGHYPYIPYIDVDFDLGSEKAIGYISINYLYLKEYGFVNPGRVQFMVSNDKQNWSTVYLEDGIQDPQGVSNTTQKFEWMGKTDGINGVKIPTVKARYVRVQYLTGFWALVDEIEIWGKDDLTGAVTLEADKPSTKTYAKPSMETSGGIHDLVLAYNQYYEDGTGNWTPEQMKPYVTYVDRNNKSIDIMFDGVLFLALNSHQKEVINGADVWHRFDATHGLSQVKPGDFADWQWYVDKSFKAGGDVWALNEAAKQAAKDLNRPDYKVNLVMMHPFPDSYQKNFGDIDGDGISENFSNAADRQKAVDWYIGEVIKRFNAGNYSHVNFRGFYWVNEEVSDSEIVKYASALTHKNNLKFFWIPYYGTGRMYKWKEMGVDTAGYQPNHFFDMTDESRVRDCAAMAKDFGMGIEVETGPEVLRDERKYDLYLDYLDGSIKYGFQGPDVFRAYYQHVYGYKLMAEHKDEKIRRAYDNTYKMIKGTLKLSNRTRVAAPAIQSTTADSVTLNPVADMEYSMDTYNWQDSNVFGGLLPNTQYSFYQRIKETLTNQASFASAPVSFKTPNTAGYSPVDRPSSNEWNFVKSDKKDVDGQQFTVASLDAGILSSELEKIKNDSVISLAADKDSTGIMINLNGRSLLEMVNKNLTISAATSDARYDLPVSAIDMKAVKEQLGGMDISRASISIRISKSNADGVKIIKDSAGKNGITVVADPVDFEITAVVKDKSVKISDFSRYVSRRIKLPDGLNASRISTGAVKGADGSLYHVPSRIVNIDGTLYLEINSRTNSTYTAVYVNRAFEDVADHWAKNQINDLANRLIISGVSATKYEPDRDITRAEFASIIVRALGLKPAAGKNPFTDVKGSAWYAGYVKTAAEYKIISGYGKGKFGPLDKITREQAMVMVTRAMNITGLKVEMDPSEVNKLLSDFGIKGIPAGYAKNNIAICIKAGIVSSKDGKMYSVKENITRAEVAVIARKLLEKSNLI